MKKVIRKQKLIKKIEKKSKKKEYPLRGIAVIYREPFKAVALSDWEAN